MERDNSDNESTNKCTTELVWPIKSKPSPSSSLHPVQKNQQEEVKFTFNVAKCDKIFDELVKSGNIKVTHTLTLLDELKKHAYYKWHNSFSHATNYCNVFRRRIQSTINEDPLSF
jgi:polyhydroxyalkanoate synthesis regulator phasin